MFKIIVDVLLEGFAIVLVDQKWFWSDNAFMPKNEEKP
jgi:hypothetical protein